MLRIIFVHKMEEVTWRTKRHKEERHDIYSLVIAGWRQEMWTVLSSVSHEIRDTNGNCTNFCALCENFVTDT